MGHRILSIAVVLVILGAAAAFTIQRYQPKQAGVLTLYGNLDDRQIDLPFQIAERIASIKVEEGARVQAGELLGTLETVRIENALREAEAACEATRQNYLKMKNGSRPEDIAIGEAGVAAAQANLDFRTKDYQRQKTLVSQSAVSQQTADQAESDYYIAIALLDGTQKELERLKAGYRVEEIAQAQAELQKAEAQIAILKQQLADTELKAPVAGIIRNRLQEPGEMSSPQKAALSLALADPKWIRVYLPENVYGSLKIGAAAKITVDSLPHTVFDGWVGYISPTAEFTPKNVESAELRPALVYEIRVFVKDPDNRLLLGQPATVQLPQL